MPAPTPLAIATQSVQRLVKEDAYYQKELAQQTERVKKLEADLKSGASAEDGNAEFVVKQEQKAIEETKAVFVSLRERIADSVKRLEEQIATGEGESTPADEIAKAKEALKLGNAVGDAPVA